MAAVASCKTRDRYSMANYMNSKMSNLYIYEGEAVGIAGKYAVSNYCAIALYSALTSEGLGSTGGILGTSLHLILHFSDQPLDYLLLRIRS